MIDFSQLNILENSVDVIVNGLNTLKDSLLIDKSIDDYYEFASYVDSLAQLLWDMEYYLNIADMEQSHLDAQEYMFVRATVTSDKKAEMLIEEKYYETKKEVSRYKWLVKKLRARYWWTTKILDWAHDWFYFNSRMNS